MSEIFDAMGIDPGIIIIILMVTTVGLIIVVMNLFSIVKKTEEKYRIFMKGEDGKSLERGLFVSLIRSRK